MKNFIRTLALIFSLVLVSGFLLGCNSNTNQPDTTQAETANSKYEFTVMDGSKTLESEITEEQNVNYYQVTLDEKSDFSLLAYNGNLEEYYNLDYKVYTDANLTNCIHESTLRVTDTDVWGEYKVLDAGTYYITLSSDDVFPYYLTFDALPVK